MNKTKIEWTEFSWNPLRGCSRVSEGCRNCYAERMARRFKDAGPFRGVVDDRGWTGKVELVESKLDEPLRRRKPSVVFVCSMSDLFHERVPFEQILAIHLPMISEAVNHTYIVLTKRPGRAKEFYLWWDRKFPGHAVPGTLVLGVSVENQKAAEERIPVLMQIPAASRAVSLEPLLGPVDLSRWLGHCAACNPDHEDEILNWVIVGGESGPGARPMHPDWARSVRNQCVSAGVPFFFKQWGEWLPVDQFGADGDKPSHALYPAAEVRGVWVDGSSNGMKGHDGYIEAWRVGKYNAGRLLDGKVWCQTCWGASYERLGYSGHRTDRQPESRLGPGRRRL